MSGVLKGQENEPQFFYTKEANRDKLGQVGASEMTTGTKLGGVLLGLGGDSSKGNKATFGTMLKSMKTNVFDRVI